MDRLRAYMSRLLALASLAALLSIVTANVATANESVVTMNLVGASGVGVSIGTISLEDTQYGLLLTPNLEGLSAGAHGFHIHQNPDCDSKPKGGRFVAGLGAGGHFDPESKGAHKGPYEDGHLGDLPPLIVDAEGKSTIPLLAPRLTVDAIAQRSIMVHLKGDNFSDEPAKLGGGGARVACGVI